MSFILQFVYFDVSLRAEETQCDHKADVRSIVSSGNELVLF
jgi:hypothetical protein